MAMTEDMAIFFDTDDFAVSVSYTALGDTVPSSITAILTEQGPQQEAYERGFVFATAEIEVKKSEVTSPQRGDTFTYDGNTWEYDPESGIVYTDEYIHGIALRRREA